MFYVNNYTDWDQFNQLYDPDKIDKDIRNAYVVARKLGTALVRAINHMLEVANEKKRKREEMVERWKIETMAAKRQRARRGIDLSSEKKEDYESDTEDEMDLDQANDEYPLQLWEAMGEKLQAASKVVYSFTNYL